MEDHKIKQGKYFDKKFNISDIFMMLKLLIVIMLLISTSHEMV